MLVPSRGGNNFGTLTALKPGGVPSTPLMHMEEGGGVVGDASVEFFDDINCSVAAKSCEKSIIIHSRVPGRDGDGSTAWRAVVSTNTLFIKVPKSIEWGENDGFGFKECVVAVMELAEEVLECSNLVVCLEKSRNDLTSLLRAFMFVGFEIVHPSVYNFGETYVLVGIVI